MTRPKDLSSCGPDAVGLRQSVVLVDEGGGVGVLTVGGDRVVVVVEV